MPALWVALLVLEPVTGEGNACQVWLALLRIAHVRAVPLSLR
jgi:hypothetical protein